MRIHHLHLLPLLLAGLLRVPLASAGLLALQVNATNAPAGALDKAQLDADIYLAKMTSLEGSSYTTVEAGMSVSDNSIRMLRGGENGAAERRLIDCPNSCSNSNSYSCRLLGCAYCGACNRRLLSEESRELLMNKQRSIEATLTTDLTAAYCNNKEGCSIKAIIKRVNSDGSMTLAV